MLRELVSLFWVRSQDLMEHLIRFKSQLIEDIEQFMKNYCSLPRSDEEIERVFAAQKLEAEKRMLKELLRVRSRTKDAIDYYLYLPFQMRRCIMTRVERKKYSLPKYGKIVDMSGA